MSHTDIIIIVVTLTFASTVGVYAAIRYTKLNTRSPENTLVRSQDIELGDYIEPIRSQQIDLLERPTPIYERFTNYLEPQYPIYERIPNSFYNERVPSQWSGVPPSYHTGIPPSYHFEDRLYINSCLENSINLDLIYWLILFSMLISIILLIRKYLTLL